MLLDVIAILTFFGADASPSTPFLVWMSSLGAFIVALATGGAFIWNILAKRKEQKLDEEKQTIAARSVTFEEMEAAIPGLGSLVDRWQSQAEAAFAEIEKLRKNESVDRQKLIAQDNRIADLELQVKVLTQELVSERSKNIKLEERIVQLEGRPKR